MNNVLFYIVILFILFKLDFVIFAEQNAYGKAFAESKKLACDKALAEAQKIALEREGILVKTENILQQTRDNEKTTSKSKFTTEQYARGILKVKDKQEVLTFDKKTGLVTCEVTALFEISPESVANATKENIQIEGDININWQDKYIIAKGFGAGNQNWPKQVWKKSAEEAARVDAKKKLAEFLSGSSIQAKTFIKNFQTESDIRIEELKSQINYTQQVGTTEYPTDSTAIVYLRMNFD